MTTLADQGIGIAHFKLYFTAMNLLPHDNTFFELFEKQASVVCEASELLATGLTSRRESTCALSVQMKLLEEQGDEIVQQMSQRLRETFLTPFEPEDVQALTTALDDVLDSIEDVTFLIATYKLEPIPEELVEFGQIIQKSCTCLKQAVSNVIRKQPVGEHCSRIGQLEKEADLLERRLMIDLFQGEPNAVTLLKRKELFESVERITDRCDDVANVLESVSVKG
ncbi:MAG TPA: DUF47 family protein [Bryobacteraceae bacterium]